jgi:RNA polymerase sigma-70 factor (ECF subfamily)
MKRTQQPPAYADLEADITANYQRVLNYVRFKVRDLRDAEDITQVVFMRAIAAMRRGKGATENPNGWLYRIAHNAIVDHYRDYDRGPLRLSLDALIDDEDDKNPRAGVDILLDDGLTPHERLEQSMTVELVRRAVENNLTCKQTDAMHMRLDGYGNEEIAAFMQTDVESVRALHTRARSALRVRLQNLMEQT